MEEKILSARLKDLDNRATNLEKPQFLGFLSENESAIAEREFRASGNIVSFFGGYDGALRTFVCVAPNFCKDVSFPIVSITATYRKQDKLSHRDFLGSLMALGITREKIGDILVEEGRTVFFAEKTIADFVLTQISKVGRVGVELNVGMELPLPELSKKRDFSSTIASTRLDCVVSALLNTSRNISANMISDSLVCVNSFLCVKPTQTIYSGDKISIRKKGRFDIVSVEDISKKGRIILKYQKYV